MSLMNKWRETASVLKAGFQQCPITYNLKINYNTTNAHTKQNTQYGGVIAQFLIDLKFNNPLIPYNAEGKLFQTTAPW